MGAIAMLHPAAQVAAIVMLGLCALAFLILTVGKL